jgi:hypothetical protein
VSAVATSQAHTRACDAAVQAAVFPGVRQTPTCCECWRSGSHERWVKNCDPTGVAAEQTSNTARGTPDIPAESRHYNTTLQDREVLSHAGPVRSGGQRDPAFRAPFLFGAWTEMGLRRSRVAKNRGAFARPGVMPAIGFARSAADDRFRRASSNRGGLRYGTAKRPVR